MPFVESPLRRSAGLFASRGLFASLDRGETNHTTARDKKSIKSLDGHKSDNLRLSDVAGM
jgi:hypothetical protein